MSMALKHVTIFLKKVQQTLNKLFLFAVRRRPNIQFDDSHRKSANALIDLEVPICTIFIRDFNDDGNVFFQNIFAFKIFSIAKPTKVFAFNAVVWKEPERNLQHKGTSLCGWKTMKVVLAVKKLINVLINGVAQDWVFPRKTFLIDDNYYYWWTHIFLRVLNLHTFFLRCV